MQKHDLEQDLQTSKLIQDKCKVESYAQNLYAAMCNVDWCKTDMLPILAGHRWSCSWRYAGGIVATIVNQGGDYMDWYCSGIWGGENFVSEGIVTDEIREDLKVLG